MRLFIDASGLFERVRLIVKGDGVRYESGALTTTRKYKFDQIDAVLMSTDGMTLVLQVKEVVMKVKVKPKNKRHKATIDAILHGVRACAV